MTTKDPSRVEKLARAQAAAITARDALNAIDLRRCSREVRSAVKEARGASDDLSTMIHQAFLTDAHERGDTTASTP